MASGKSRNKLWAQSARNKARTIFVPNEGLSCDLNPVHIWTSYLFTAH
jgi:hypothetical protein